MEEVFVKYLARDQEEFDMLKIEYGTFLDHYELFAPTDSKTELIVSNNLFENKITIAPKIGSVLGGLSPKEVPGKSLEDKMINNCFNDSNGARIRIKGKNYEVFYQPKSSLIK